MMDFWIITTAFCIALSAGSLGSFLLLRGMSMLADTISHAVLPGIALGFLWTANKDSPLILLLAFVFGFIATFLVQLLQKTLDLPADQSIGTTYIWLFSLGLLLISYFADTIDLDLDHVLFGEIQYVWLPPYLHFKTLKIPIHFIPIFANTLLVLTFFYFFFERLKLLSFDLCFAEIRGLKTEFWQHMIMALVALTAVTAFEHVGSVMVLGFFVILPAISFLWVKSFAKMLWLCLILNVLLSPTSYYLALLLDIGFAGVLLVNLSAVLVFSVLFLYFYPQQQVK